MSNLNKHAHSPSGKATTMSKKLATITSIAAAVAALTVTLSPGFDQAQGRAAIDAGWSTAQVFDLRRDIAFRGRESAPDGVQVAHSPASVDSYGVLTQASQVTMTTGGVQDFVGPQPGAEADDEPDPVSRARSPRSKMSEPVAALAAAGGNGMVQIIARYDEHPELFDDEFVASLGGEVTRSYRTLDMRAISIPASSLEALAVNDNVDWLSLDDEMSATASASHLAMNMPSTASPNAAYTGSSIAIAVVDTGVSQHSDIGANVVQYSFLNGAYPVPVIVNGEVSQKNDGARQDLFGHGTHVAGILAGSGDSSNGNYKGAARQSTLLSLQVLNASGAGSMSDVMAALDWLSIYGSYYGIRVVNLSLGKGISESNTTDPLVIAVEKLWDAGMVVVVAAGNNGNAGNMTVTSPGNSRKVITVGSLTDSGTGVDFSDDFVSTFSSKGPTVGDMVMKPDLVAPGNRIVAAIPANSMLGTYLPTRMVGCIKVLGITTCQNAYLEMSGTSMATPMVSAAVALMLEKDPTLTPATIKARLMRSSRKLDADPTGTGAGVLDVDAALNDVGVLGGEALSPLVSFDATTDMVLIEDTATSWGGESWGPGYLFYGGFAWTAASSSTDGGITATGYGWTDRRVGANGYGWTDGAIGAKGYGWTDGIMARSLLDTSNLDGSGVVLNDDP